MKSGIPNSTARTEIDIYCMRLKTLKGAKGPRNGVFYISPIDIRDFNRCHLNDQR